MPPGGRRPEQDDVVVGVVGKPVGLRGEVYVHPEPDLQPAFEAGSSYRTADGRRLSVESTRLHAGRRIVRFVGVSGRDDAEALRGTVLVVPRTQVELDEDAYWTGDVIGRDVVDQHGALVGVVEATRDGPAHDYLLVARPDGGELLIPAVEALVRITGEQVVVQAIPGLIPGMTSGPPEE